MLRQTNYLTSRYDEPQGWTIAPYERDGGYLQAKRALAMPRNDLVEEMKAANIRGRGGAGFPMGVKWSFMPYPPKPEKPHYLVINADEGEPGTFKDRTIMERNPHSVVEGCIIGCFGIGAHAAYIYVRDELHLSKDRLWAAIAEAKAKGYLGKKPFGIDYEVEVYVHTGAGAYICGEETALLNSLEGKRGEPRLKPPFPAQAGAFGMPSTVNNLETIAIVPTALAMGGEAFSKLSDLHHLKDGGSRLFGVSGHVNKPGVYEKPVAYNLKKLIMEDAGGVLGGRALKAVIPGGSSAPVLAAHEIDISMEFDAVKAAGSMSGSGGVIVFDESACMVRALARLSKFYAEESCGQCTPCREGTNWMEGMLERIEAGHASAADVARLEQVANSIAGNTICALGDAAAMPVQSFLKKFKPEFLAHTELRRCPCGDTGWGLTQEPRDAVAGPMRYAR